MFKSYSDEIKYVENLDIGQEEAEKLLVILQEYRLKLSGLSQKVAQQQRHIDIYRDKYRIANMASEAKVRELLQDLADNYYTDGGYR